MNNIGDMFDDIAFSYDRLNAILSFGIDDQWRQSVIENLPLKKDLVLLDVACGTADLLIKSAKARSDLSLGFGVDISSKMLSLGQNKIDSLNFLHKLKLIKADATFLPFLDNSFDVVTIAFGIRNIVDIDKALKEFLRVLKPGGLMLILEFSLPKNILIKVLYLFYFRYILPIIGGLLSGNIRAYRYLNRSVESFYSPKEFLEILKHNGFSDIRAISLSYGIASIYRGRK